MKRANSANCETIISKGYQTAYWLGFCNGGRIRFYARGNAYQDGNLVIPANIWTHIAVVYQGSGRRYYVNGELDYQGGLELSPTTNTQPVWIGSDPDTGCCDFQGKISNVRLWNVARTQDEIRRTMHQALVGPRDGLVANWRFSEDMADNIGGFDGTAVGGALLNGDYVDPPPAQMPTVPFDKDFNQMALGRRYNGIAYIPRLDRALIIGGRTHSGAVGAETKITAVSAATGETRVLDNLPTGSTKGTAVYVPTRDRVYYFGGVPDYYDNAPQNTVYAIAPETGAPATLSVTLPQPLFGLTAVYYPGWDKVLLLGGHDATAPVSTISLFDPATESITATTAFSLPEPLSSVGAAYSPLTDSVYVFGGFTSDTGNSESNRIYQLTLNSAGDDGSITLLPTLLPKGFHFIQAISDPNTRLIYLSGGYNGYNASYQTSIWIFDPLTNELWDTPMFTFDRMDGTTGFHSPRQRHILYIGGYRSGTWLDVWRLPVGDGPPVPLGHWDFPAAVSTQVNDIDVEGSTAAIATKGDGAWLYRSNGTKTHLTKAMLGSTSGVVNNVRYNDTYNHTFIATDDAGAQWYDGSTLTSYTGIGTTQTLSIDTRPGYTDVNSAQFVGAVNGLHYPKLIGSPPFQLWVWDTAFSGESVRAIAHRRTGDVWMINGSYLKNLTYTSAGSTGTTNYGAKCGLLDPTDIAFARNSDWWIVSPGQGDLGGNGICRIPAAPTPGAGSTAYVDSTIGDLAWRVSVDGDGRVWTALGQDALSSISGGLAAFEVTGAYPGTLVTESWNWLSAPIGSTNYQSNAYWDSTLTAVGAADERIWLGKPDGRLITLAQRWQQLDDRNDIGNKVIQDIWTVRGRAFLATGNSLHVLQPDGETWDNRTGMPRVWDVLGDSQGRVWVATDTGVRLYTPTGWDYLTDKPGTRPTTAVYALAKDNAGRIWMGGQNGLTLFDRERFVATFTPTNSDLPALPITDLTVDRQNRLWAGTNSGLAQLDGASWTLFTTADGLPDNSIFDLLQLDSGEIVVSTANGLSFYNGSSFSTQTLPIPANNLPIAKDNFGRLYAGRAVFNGATWEEYYTTNSGLAGDEISGIASDDADRIWFSHAPDPGVSVRGTYLPPLGTVIPQITGISPTVGSSGDIITITGSGFPARYSDGTTVTIGDATAEIISTSETQLEVRLTDYNTSGDVSVQIRGGARTTQTDAFCARPVISGFTPTGGNDGVWVTINGTNFDYTAEVQLGGGPARLPINYSLTQLRTRIQPGDGIGAIVVNNACSGVSATSTGDEFRRLTVSVAQMVLNQGIPSMGLVATKPTMVQHYLNVNPAARTTDLVEIDSVQLDFTEGGSTQSYLRNVETRVPTVGGTPSATDLADIDNSLNVTVTPVLGGNLVDSVSLQTTLKNNGQVVAVGNTDAVFRPNLPLRVLLVPIMANDYTPSELYAMKLQVNTGLDDLRRRIFPTGNVELYWSPMTLTANDVIVFGGETVDIGNSAELYDASHNLDSARRMWNEYSDQDVLVAFGVVQDSINRNTTVSGLAFWPDVSQMINAAGLSAVDSLCDVGSAILNFFTLGAVDGGCDLEIPLYVGWAKSTDLSSQLIGHELGHTMGLVRIPSVNANLGDNFSHSTSDEINGGTCSDLENETASYQESDTLYRAPGVSDPVVNPITGVQWRPGLNMTGTLFISSTKTLVDEALYSRRGKAIMSYACRKNNQNAYFEPVDQTNIMIEYAMAPGRLFADLSPLRQINAAEKVQRTTTPTPIFVPGTRLYLSGEVTATVGTGKISQVRVLGDVASLDMSFVTAYALVQLDAGGTELARTGLFPSFRTAAQTSDVGFWATTLVAAPGVATIELRQDATVLDSISAGSQSPVVNLSAPTGGAFSGSDVISVTWTATDGDGDALTAAILYSADGGSNWMQVGFSGAGSGDTVGIPISQLAGSTDGRIKVTVSDGLHQGEVVSPPITVENQPPQPFIGAPAAGSEFLEGTMVELSGGAFDNLDLMVDGANLAWQSDRDGWLGTGATLDVVLSVGNHTVTLTATNSVGVSATAAVTLTVNGDYDLDGIADTDELADGLNLLTAVDAFSDADGDGLSLRVERKRGLNPNNPDSDGDGRNDGQEVADGTNPNAADAPLPPDSLQVYPPAINLTADLSRDVMDPQAPLQLISRDILTWTLTADVGWLNAFKTQGQTPDQVTTIVNVDRLSGDGVYTGNLFFATNLGTVAVPVTLTATNVPSQNIYLPLVLKQ